MTLHCPCRGMMQQNKLPGGCAPAAHPNTGHPFPQGLPLCLASFRLESGAQPCPSARAVVEFEFLLTALLPPAGKFSVLYHIQQPQLKFPRQKLPFSSCF